ncbi:hypothetical protein DAEQUDRAFT_730993 [Daedalea quercina L-15889]|uniref:tRNA-splicing endonuclease subunit Sen54 N-terminal domain-containing protein n=1 Tax=Daedalea quercina L-15889 TaxID=1314783 RepID=A0A165MKT2_9APHY|nr:hypothetical protein DAEQUDRAFT_730993 [Daedalea quercina L-15889]
MDDTLERPTSISKPVDLVDDGEDEQSSGEEDQGPDWTKIPSVSTARPFIPKRGEKDFEPTAAGGSGLQRHVLDRSRHAMLEALSAPRTISSKSVSYAVWYPDIARAHVTMSRGIHFTNMGHSVARTTSVEDSKKFAKRLELLPEETLYLVERGAMLCWKASDLVLTDAPGLDDIDGVPMTVQHAFAEMIGTADLTLEQYQVFAYLKRLGYVVTRTKPPNPEYPVPSLIEPPKKRRVLSCFGRVLQLVQWPLQLLLGLVSRFDWWRPIRLSCLQISDTRSLFRSLRFLPGGHDVPLHVKVSPRVTSPYEIFYNVYKPSTPFKKTAPPPPDYSVVVVNARTTPMPTLTELAALFGALPELPPPLPRKRQSFAQHKADATAPPPASTSQTTHPPSSLVQRLFPWAFPSRASPEPVRNANPFLSLKTGKKMVVIAAVDAGMTSFFRFGEGVFTEWPMA